MFGTTRVSREVLYPLMEVDEPLCSAAGALSTVLVGEGASRVPRVSKACSLEQYEQVVSIATRIEPLVACSFGLLEHRGAVTRHALESPWVCSLGDAFRCHCGSRAQEQSQLV